MLEVTQLIVYIALKKGYRSKKTRLLKKGEEDLQKARLLNLQERYLIILLLRTNSTLNTMISKMMMKR
jgi:hypothetical protein